MYNHKLLRFLLLLIIVAIVIVAAGSNVTGIALSSLQVDSAQNTYLPVLMNRYPSSTLFGVTMFTLDGPGGLMQFADGGTRWTRNGFDWSSIEPYPGDRFWNADLDQQLVNAAYYHIESVMLIEAAPKWAITDPNLNCGPVAQDKLPALASFAYDLVKRYSAPPFYVHYWELWNEPDAAGILGCWGDPTKEFYGGEYYGEMLKVVYPQIKLADPQAQVLVGGLLLDCDPVIQNCHSSKFFEGILKSSAGAYFDGVSFHAYDYYNGTGTYFNPNWNSTSSTTGPVLIAKANYLRGLLSQYGFIEKYLMNTETAVFYGDNVDYPRCDPNAPADIEVTKVNYLVQSYATAVAERLKANIWYAALGGRCAALLNDDLSPKPAYYAYQFAQQNLGNASFIRQISEYQGVMGYEYEVPGVKLWVIWAKDGQTHSVTLPAQPLRVTKVGATGQPEIEPNNLTLMIDQSPRFIEFGK